jgi:RNA polymerase sigma-54 factor
MEFQLSPQTSQEQKQILSQRQIESLDILSMDTETLRDFLSREQEENPLLNLTPGTPNRVAIRAEEDDFLANIPAPRKETAEELLLSQLTLGNYAPDEERAFRLIAASVDGSGFLRIPLRSLSETSGIALPIFEKCLRIMQSLEPAGVCATSLEECLLLQLTAKNAKTANAETDEVLLEILRSRLRDVADGKIGRIARDLNTTTLHVRRCVKIIRSLVPRPLNGLTGEGGKPITPDIVMTCEKGEWDVEINDNWYTTFEVSDHYERLTAMTEDAELREYFKEKKRRIRFIQDAIEKRRDTLLRLARCLAHHQRAFLLGEGPLSSFSMLRAAEELGVHPSTISRAANGKYAQYPGGFREIRALFAQSAASSLSSSIDATGSPSREEVQKCLAELIGGEDPAKPLSDSGLALALRERCCEVSRRTVAKYRMEMGIKGMHDRRCV